MNDISQNNPITIDFTDIELARQLFGEHNSNLQRIAEATEITVNARSRGKGGPSGPRGGGTVPSVRS